MPYPDISIDKNAVLRGMEQKPLVQGIFGWGCEWYVLKYLVDVGYVEIFYDWEDRRAKAELTDAGRSHVERDRLSHRSTLDRSREAVHRSR